MRIGIGLGAFPVLGVLLNLIKIPLDWRIFLFISLFLPVYDFFAGLKKFKFSKLSIAKPNSYQKFLFLFFIFCIIIYCWGAFTYPWLENDDSWPHAAGAKYVAIEKNVSTPSGIFNYINPYPPGYDLFIGVLHQTSPSMYWTIKFFNGLIVALGILFFFYFAKEFTNNSKKATLATFFLTCIPCYLSHFIWAHSLAVTLFIPAFYLILKSIDEKKYVFPAGIVSGGIFLTSPTQPIKFTILLLILIAVTSLVRKQFQKNLSKTFLIAIIIALFWYLPVLQQAHSGKLNLHKSSKSADLSSLNKFYKLTLRLFNPEGGATTKVHTLKHFLYPPRYNDRNNPFGVGIALCILALIGIFIALNMSRKGGEKDKIYSTTILLWLVFTFLGVNSMTFSLPIGLFSYRFWALFAIPVSFLAAETAHIFVRDENTTITQRLSLIIIIAASIVTSAYPKFVTNTYLWHYGAFWSSAKEIKSYLWLRRNLKINTKVFAFTENMYVIGHDMRADFWKKKYYESYKNAIHFSPSRLKVALNLNGFEYLIISERDINKFSKKVITEKVEELDRSKLFKKIFEIKNAAWIFKLN